MRASSCAAVPHGGQHGDVGGGEADSSHAWGRPIGRPFQPPKSGPKTTMLEGVRD